MTSLLHHEAPTTIRARAAALTEYLLAVRAQMEKPARTVPTGSAIWQNGLPEHPDCRLGPRDADSSWLSVGRPPKPKPLATPGRISSMLFGPIEATREPVFRAPSGLSREEVEDRAAEVAEWVESTWRPWAVAVRRITATRELHARLIELRSRLDMNAAGEELVWGHGVVHVEVAGYRVAYPLVATPVAVDYDADRAVVSASPQGPARLQTDALTGLDDQSLRQLLGLGDGGLVAVDLWDDLERRELFERALRRLGHDPVLRIAHAPAVGGAHIHDTGVLFVGPRQRMLRRFLEQLRDRLLAGDTETIGALASVLAHEPSRLEMPSDDPRRWQPARYASITAATSSGAFAGADSTAGGGRPPGHCRGRHHRRSHGRNRPVTHPPRDAWPVLLDNVARHLHSEVAQ